MYQLLIASIVDLTLIINAAISVYQVMGSWGMVFKKRKGHKIQVSSH